MRRAFLLNVPGAPFKWKAPGVLLHKKRWRDTEEAVFCIGTPYVSHATISFVDGFCFTLGGSWCVVHISPADYSLYLSGCMESFIQTPKNKTIDAQFHLKWNRTRRCMFHAFTFLSIHWFWAKYGEKYILHRMFHISVCVKDTGCPLSNRFCTILTHRCTILPYSVKHIWAWKKWMFHHIHLWIREIRGWWKRETFTGQKPSLVGAKKLIIKWMSLAVAKSLFTMLMSHFTEIKRVSPKIRLQ